MNSISLDCLFLINLCVNFVIFKLIRQILGKITVKNVRLCMGAVACALLECLSCVFPQLLTLAIVTSLVTLLGFLVFFDLLGALIYTCFSLWSGIFMTLMMKFFKGVIVLDNNSSTELTFAKNRLIFAAFAVLALTFLKLYFDKKQKMPSKASLYVVYGDKKASLLAMRDSGNLLKDPLSGRSVAILSKNGAKKLGVNFDTISKSGTRFRVVPVKSVGHTGILYAFLPDGAMIDGKKRDLCLALDSQNADFSGFDAIIPSNL